ncbi:hypothetical protein WJX72_003512 [[Myrmecia] bisecta]|uniref:Uncharacterized protein n=1 Tax=[Myrmecia] bisecta TaxID=41462 RepID=A0AAW1PH42_9CHLO
MDKDTKDLLMERFAGVTIVDAASLPYPEHHQIVPVEHYVVKAYAFYHCPFDQVLVLDADNLPLADPTSLFDDPAFQQHGSLFWPDFGRDLPQSAYQMFGLHAPSTHGPDAVTQTDAGQFLLDRRRHADVIEWVWFLNSYGPGGIYQHTWSDKETYQLAFHLAGKPGDFQQVKQRPRSIMCRIGPDTEDDRRFMVTAAMQHAPDGVPLFAHRTGDGKVDPLTNWECTDMEYVSVPLNPERAARLFAPDRGQHSYADETGLLVDFTEMQVKIDESRHALERKPSKACMASSPLRFHLDCGYDFEGDSVPVPFVEFQDFEQPIVFGVIRAAERIYRTIRPIIRTGVMFGNTCATYSAEVGIQCQNLEEQMTAVRKAH